MRTPRAMRRVELAPKNAAVRITLYHSHDFQEGSGGLTNHDEEKRKLGVKETIELEYSWHQIQAK